MIRKELKRLSRRELVDIIYQMKKNEQQMQEKITSLQQALEDKRIRISAAGSVAEVAADITRVLSAAQETADLYLQEIAAMKEDTVKICVKMQENVKAETDRVRAEREAQLAELTALCDAERQRLDQLRSELQQSEEKACEEIDHVEKAE